MSRPNNSAGGTKMFASSSRPNLLAPSQRQGRPLTAMNSKDDLLSERYIMEEPEGVYPLIKLKNGEKILPDFRPWHKTKTEDSLTTEYLQKGYYEAPIVANEAGSARNAMSPILKQRSSLSALSYFMINTMEVRAKNCRITSNTTFKPPPRVTLTDQKRETWLRDLATPSVPLRRLSRTIPHGIRNKGLLDQCCNKSIPVSRAIWFTRCVGANELRGLKRKGNNASGMPETIWIQEWTEQVTEYVEKMVKDYLNSSSESSTSSVMTTSTSSSSSIVTATASSSSFSTTIPPWRSRLEYMTRLISHLFSEDLLDKPLFLKWCLDFFSNGEPEELPVSLVYIRLFWTELMKSRNRSQVLALALVNQYSLLGSGVYAKNEIFANLRGKIADFIRQLFLVSPDSFVLPQHWQKIGPILSETFDNSPDLGGDHTFTLTSSSSSIKELLHIIRTRNESLIVSDAPLVRALRNHRRRVIDVFDKLTSPYSFHDITSQLSGIRVDSKIIISTLFEWAATFSRTGQDRIYICARLAKYWHDSLKWPIPECFQDFLKLAGDGTKYRMDNIFDMVALFLNYDLFPVGTYFRTLVSSGVLFIPRLRVSCQGTIDIFANLPLNHVSNELRIHQQMILRRLKCYNESEALDLEKAIQMVTERIRIGYNEGIDDLVDLSPAESIFLDSLQKGCKAELADWILRTTQSNE